MTFLMQASRSALLSIFSIVFIDLLGFGIVIPILPYYAQSYGASGWTLGWLMTSYSLLQFLFAPVWGRLSDHYGRRPILLMSLLGSGIGLLILGFASNLWILFLGRILAGISGANISTAYAYISDVTTPENRAKGMGIIGAGFGLGFVFGPALGGFLSQWGYSTPMFVGAAMAFLNTVWTAFVLKEPPLTPEQRAARRQKRDWNAFKQLRQYPASATTVFIFFTVTLAITQMEVVFALYMAAQFQFDAYEAGMALAAFGFLMALIQGGLIGRLSKRWGERNLILFGSILGALALFLYGMTSNLNGALGALCLMAVAYGLLHPSLSSWTSKGAPASEQGWIMGVFQSGGSLARVIGPPVAGFLYDQVSIQSPFYAGSVLLAFGAIIVIGKTTSK